MKNKRILITGGTGSFGRAFAKKILTEEDPHSIVIFSRDEWKQWEMRNSDPIFQSEKIRYFLGDIRDRSRLKRAFQDVNYVVHAAALKQVPAAEYNPTEFILTNVLGSSHIIEASLDAGVEKVIALSTDKAVNPVNLYGATKLCADKLFISGNSYVGRRGFPIFSVARYGNVLKSRGSLIELWKKKIQEGAKSLPITDERMTRFWMTIEQATSFVVQSLREMQGGEIFVPKIPSMKICDVAKTLAPNLPTEIVGIREGEKVHELLISEEEGRRTVDRGSYYVISGKESKELFMPEGFFYGSQNNDQWLKPEELSQLLAN